MNNTTGAVEYFRLAVAAGLADENVLTEFAATLQKVGAYEDALEILNVPEELSLNTLLFKADLMMQVGGEKNLREALVIYDALLTHTPNDPILLTRFAEVCVQLQAFISASNTFYKLATLFPNDPILAKRLRQSYLEAARNCVDTENFARAVKYFNRLNPIGDPVYGTEEVIREFANAYAKNGQPQKAIALLLDKKQFPSEAMLSGVYETIGDYDKALAIFEKLLVANPKSPNLLAHTALALEVTDRDPRRGLQLLNRLKEVEPNLAEDDVFRYIRFLAKTGDTNAAFKEINTLEKTYGKTKEITNAYLDVVATLAKPSAPIRSKTLQIYQSLLNGDFANATFQDFFRVAIALKNIGLLAEANNSLNVGLQKFPTAKRLILLKAQILNEMGKPQEAKGLYDTLFKMTNANR